jgi:hypothetical protein
MYIYLWRSFLALKKILFYTFPDGLRILQDSYETTSSDDEDNCKLPMTPQKRVSSQEKKYKHHRPPSITRMKGDVSNSTASSSSSDILEVNANVSDFFPDESDSAADDETVVVKKSSSKALSGLPDAINEDILSKTTSKSAAMISKQKSKAGKQKINPEPPKNCTKNSSSMRQKIIYTTSKVSTPLHHPFSPTRRQSTPLPRIPKKTNITPPITPLPKITPVTPPLSLRPIANSFLGRKTPPGSAFSQPTSSSKKQSVAKSESKRILEIIPAEWEYDPRQCTPPREEQAQLAGGTPKAGKTPGLIREHDNSCYDPDLTDAEVTSEFGYPFAFSPAHSLIGDTTDRVSLDGDIVGDGEAEGFSIANAIKPIGEVLNTSYVDNMINQDEDEEAMEWDSVDPGILAELKQFRESLSKTVPGTNKSWGGFNLGRVTT